MNAKNSFFPEQIIFAVLGAACLWYVTRFGIGVSSDSIAYMSAADHLLSSGKLMYFDEGEIRWFTQWTPVYALFLAALKLFGLTFVIAERWMNIALFAANILLAGNIVHRITQSRWAVFLISILLCSSVSMIEIHSWAWSEPLFLFFTMMSFWFLANYGQGFKWSDFLWAALFAGLAFGTRYVGVAVIGSCALMLLFHHGPTFLKRLRNAVLFGILSGGPMFLWILSNKLTTGLATNRNFVFHKIYLSQLLLSMRTCSDWFLPKSIPDPFKYLFFIVFLSVIAAAITILLKRKNQLFSLVNLLIVFIFFYAALLLFALSFYTSATPLDFRILFPVYPFVIILTVAGVFFLSRSSAQLKPVVILLVCLWIASYFGRAASWVTNHKNASGFTSVAWRTSPIIAFIKNLPEGTPVYSNVPEAFYFITGLETKLIPKIFFDADRRANPAFEKQLDDMHSDLKEHGGYLIYFEPKDWREYLISEEELLERLPLKLVFSSERGSIYQYDFDTERF